MIGVFGGTFDPIHYGHLRVAIELHAIFKLSQMRVVPCARPAHREQPKADSHHRLEMLKLAIINQPDLILDDQEFQRAGVSYTVDTLSALRLTYPATPILLFIGSDAFNGFVSWHRWQSIIELAHIVVVNRPAAKCSMLEPFFQLRLTKNILDLQQQIAGCLFFQDITPLSISSTAIRHMIATAKSPSFLLPDVVIDYIKRYGLYQS